MTKKQFITLLPFIIQSSIILFLGVILFTQYLRLPWSQEEIYTNCQPEEINYQEADPYCVRVVEKKIALATKKEIWITTESNSSFGYSMEYPIQSHLYDKEWIEQNLKVEWTEQGVNIDTESTQIFVPKDNFKTTR